MTVKVYADMVASTMMLVCKKNMVRIQAGYRQDAGHATGHIVWMQAGCRSCH